MTGIFTSAAREAYACRARENPRPARRSRMLTTHRPCHPFPSMETMRLTIEMYEDGLTGIVRHRAHSGENLPDLIANPADPRRFSRLTKFLGTAKSLAAQELGEDEAEAFVGAMISIFASEAGYNVVWRRSAHKPVFETILNRVLLPKGDETLRHEIDPDQ
jgi:hypothetical protein